MLKRKSIAVLTTLALAWALIASVRTSFAQSCAYATITIDSTTIIDANAICDAAKPLADAGYNVLVYMTDFSAETESEWFAHLDQVEEAAGLLDSSGNFDRSGLSIEATTSTTEEWAYSMNIGERLFDTPLDSDNGFAVIQQTLRGNIEAGDPTTAFVEALGEAGGLLGVNGTSSIQSGDSGDAVSTAVDGEQTSRANTLLLGAVALGAAGVGGMYIYPNYIRPALGKRKDEEERSEHLVDLQQRVANLLLACERLLDGDSIEDSVLYQLFEAYGGRNYPEEDSRVRAWLQESKTALNDAFAVRTKLLDPEVQASRGQQQLISDWEKIYVTLVGSQERIVKLSDDELHVLLDPLQILERKPANSQLTKELDTIKRELDGLPLRVELQKVDVSKMDAEGVLGYLDGVQVEIGNLQAAQAAAPDRLAHARKELEDLEAEIPRPFAIAEDKLLTKVKSRLAEAEGNLQQGLYLRVLEDSQEIEEDLDIVEDLIAVVNVWQVREKQIQRVLDGGYTPKDLPEMQHEIAQNTRAIESSLEAGDYANVSTWIDELNTDSLRAHNYAIEWRGLEQKNAEKINEIRNGIDHMKAYRTETATMAWSSVQQYTQGNWHDVADGWEVSGELLRTAMGRLNKLEQLNTMDFQRFDEAQSGLETLYADLATSMGQMEDIVNRLDEIRAARANIDPAIEQADLMLKKAVAYRDSEDAKISGAIDEQLKSAAARLDASRGARDDKNYIDAINKQTEAEELATEAYRSSNEQVATINQLFHKLNDHVQQTEPRVEKLLEESDHLRAAVLSEQILLQIGRLRSALSDARQEHSSAAALEDVELAAGLTSANAAYDSAETLAQEIEQSIEGAKQAYAELFEQAKLDRQRAIRAIADAKRKGQQLGAGSQWRHYFDKAERTLPEEEPSAELTQKQLERIQRLSADAFELAERAERTAAQSIQENEQRQRRMNQSWGRPTQRWGGGSWGGVPRRVPRMRPNSGMPNFGGSNMPGMGGGIGGGSRRRAGGMGSSRRRSGGGGGSRRR